MFFRKSVFFFQTIRDIKHSFDKIKIEKIRQSYIFHFIYFYKEILSDVLKEGSQKFASKFIKKIYINENCSSNNHFSGHSTP